MINAQKQREFASCLSFLFSDLLYKHPSEVSDICRVYSRFLLREDCKPLLDFNYLVIGNKGWGYYSDPSEVSKVGDCFVAINLSLIDEDSNNLIYIYHQITLAFLRELKCLGIYYIQEN